MKTLKTPYGKYDVEMIMRKYSNGRHAIELVDVEDGMPVMTATVNVPEADIDDNEVIIKDYSENRGVLEFLQENGVVGPVKKTVGIGFVSVPVVELLKESL